MWQYLILLLLAVLSAIVYDRFTGLKRNGKRLRRPPGTLPLAGYGIWFLRPRHQLLKWFADVQPRMGLETFEIPIPTLPPAVLINDPRNLEYVLKNHELFVKGKFFHSNSWDLFGNGILNVDGELWRIQRKAGLRFFSNSNLQHFIDNILPKLLVDFEKRLNGAAESDSMIDLQEEFLILTTRLMGEVAYDMDITPSMHFSRAFDYASAVTADRFTSPLWRVTDFLRGSKFKPSLREIKSFGRTVVAAAQEKRSKQQASVVRPAQTMHSNLINSFLDNISDPKIVADAATNFLSAGRDTTAQSLTWTIYSLLRHPHLLDALISSLEHSFPQYARGESLPLSYSNISNPHDLPLAQAIFAETTRLNPAVPFEMKESTAPTTLPDGTYLPNGAVVLWIPYGLARSPSIWGPDPAQFDPYRWIQKDEKDEEYIITKSAFENPVFNAGPRMCIGKRLAEVLALRVFPELLWKWEFTEVRGKGEVDGVRVTAESLTAPMEGGLPVLVKRCAIR